MNDYSEIFNARAKQYHLAMQTCPKARDAEFLALLQDLPASAIDVLDVPAGGGYLARYLQSHLQLTSCDFSEGFVKTGMPLANPQTLPYAADTFDAVLSLTGLHHVSFKNQNAFLRESHRVLRSKGSFLVGEVLRGSPVDAFLNDFVHQNNSQGHSGDFFDEGFKVQLAEAGFEQISMCVRSYVWQFADVASMLCYCKNMFGIDKASDSELERGLCEYLNYRQAQNGTVQLPWQLVFYHALKG